MTATYRSDMKGVFENVLRNGRFRFKKIANKFKATIRINNLKTYFFISNNFQSNILNILAALSVMSIFFDISKLKRNIFIGFKIPNGRGDIAKIKIDNKIRSSEKNLFYTKSGSFQHFSM